MESNQPFGLFRPALIHLSYPTVSGAPGRIRTRSFDVRSVALFQLSYRSNELERAVRLELTIPDLQSGALAAWRRAQVGTEGEIRTLESSLEDSHVSSYITSAKNHCHKEAQKTQKRFLCFYAFLWLRIWSGRTESNCHHEFPGLGCERYTTPRN